MSTRALLVLAPVATMMACGPLDPASLSTAKDLPPDTFDAVSRGEARDLLVLLTPHTSAAALTAEGSEPAAASLRVEELEGLKASFRSELDLRDLDDATDYSHLPMMALRVRSPEALARIALASGVVRVFADEPHEAFLTQSLPLIGQPAAAAAGNTGSGVAVAVLDTGVDYTRAAFGSCASAGAPGCKVIRATDMAPDDGALDDIGHGTNVAGIVLGVAPGANVIALDVFRSDGLGYSTDIVAAINWCIANKATYNIVAMNLSLGGGAFSAACGTDAFATPIASARAAGIFPAIAAGNSGYTNQLASPACVPAAVSVGAVYDSSVGGIGWSGCSDATTAADKVTCFSNSASFLTMLAPGALITAAGSTMGGTSQAAPHVAGAAAVIRAAFPSETVDQSVSRLTQNGVQVTDTRNSIVKPRLALAASVGQGLDVTAPTGTISITGGATATRVAAVSLAFAATDDVGVTQMCISNTTTCTAWVTYATTLTWTLATGDGTKTVYATFRDARGNTSTPVSTTIVRDGTLPVNGTVTAAPGNTQVSLSWSGFTDVTSGLASYKVVFATGSAPASCTAGTVLSTGSNATTFVHTGLTNGTRYGYRVCAVDVAGNTSAGATVLSTPVLETDPPTGTVRINGGAAYTRTAGVTLTFSVTDASAVTNVCMSTAATCTSWVAYAETKPFTLTTAAGLKTVNVWFRDTWGNASTSPATATITLDTVAPTNGTARATPADGSVTISWSGFADNTGGSGVAAVRVVYAASTTAPANCATAGTLLYDGTDAQAVHTGATNGTTYAYRVCARDTAGNYSTGVTVTARPAPEFNPPTGTVTINGGANFTASTSATLTISATDESTVASMCVSNTTTCTAWVAYATSRTQTLTTGAGTKTVYVWFRDAWGNTSATPVTDTIVLDTTRPTNGTLRATVAPGSTTLTWSGAADGTGSGIVSYTVVYRTSTAPASCTAGTPLYTGADLTVSHAGTAGTTYGYRVCAVDAVGNVAAGATVTARAQ